MTVPFYRIDPDQATIDNVITCLRSGWLTTGPLVHRFETEFISALESNVELHAVALNSCTAALHLALDAIGLRRGDAVIVPTMTFAATAEVVRYFDAIPVLVDTDPSTFNLSMEALARLLASDIVAAGSVGLIPTDRIRAVIPVHYGGQPCDLDAVQQMIGPRDIEIIEDAAHAFPAGWGDASGARRMVGANTSRVTCFSFYANKTITTGEGGMAITADADLAARIRLMSLHGMNRDAWRRFEASGTWDYQLVAPGFKYNLTDLAAAIGLAQLARAEEYRIARERVTRMYDSVLGTREDVDLLVRQPDTLHSYHLYVMKLRLERLRIDRARFIEEMRDRGVICSVHWRPLHMHPYYIETYGYAASDYPVAAAEWPRIVSLPLFPSMRDDEISHVIENVTDVLDTYAL